jgi:hypothetical protein
MAHAERERDRERKRERERERERTHLQNNINAKLEQLKLSKTYPST